MGRRIVGSIPLMCGSETGVRIETVTLSRIMDDFGYLLGEFAMESEAFARFRDAASEGGHSL